MEHTTHKDHNLLEVKISECPTCGNFRGYAVERDNGEVPVLCKCDLEEEYVQNDSFPSPSLISPDGKQMWWTPTTDYRREDGELIHVPFFAGPSLINKFDNPQA